MDKEIKVVFLPMAKEVYDLFLYSIDKSKFSRMMLKSINKKVSILKKDKEIGDSISKKLIPKEYKLKYNVNNLFRVELPGYWRMLYTVKGEELQIISFIVDILDHKKYSKKFGYKK